MNSHCLKKYFVEINKFFMYKILLLIDFYDKEGLQIF